MSVEGWRSICGGMESVGLEFLSTRDVRYRSVLCALGQRHLTRLGILPRDRWIGNPY